MAHRDTPRTVRDRPIDLGMDRHVGTVTRVLADKGFCFILSDQDGKEYFLHRSCTGIDWAQMHKGLRVNFIHTLGQKGYRALDARPEEE